LDTWLIGSGHFSPDRHVAFLADRLPDAKVLPGFLEHVVVEFPNAEFCDYA
jgi:hypothetical protein